MTEPLRRRTGGQILIDQLKIHGVDMAFGVPGESYLAALDALFEARNQIRFLICRQEGGACNMAEAYGKLTGRPGICFVTRGPGATNASIGLHTAFQDSTPLILLIGQVARDQTERECPRSPLSVGIGEAIVVAHQHRRIAALGHLAPQYRADRVVGHRGATRAHLRLPSRLG